MGFQVTGIDFSREMIDAARQQARDHAVDLHLRVMDACDMDFPSGEFDGALFAFNGYELITTREKRAAALRSIARVLRPGGQFILTARSGVAFWRRWVGWAWMFIRHFLLRPLGLSNPHLKLGDQYRNGLLHHYITPFAVRRELRAAGFEVQLFNSPRNLDRGRLATFFTNFSPDISLFHVARKIT